VATLHSWGRAVPVAPRASLRRRPCGADAAHQALAGCGVNDRFWVFASGLTDVQVLITVTDTQTGRTRRYFNRRGKAFAPVQDTAAFACE
jgi:hypothetical protein